MFWDSWQGKNSLGLTWESTLLQTIGPVYEIHAWGGVG